MPPPRFSTRVRSYELDALGHANHAVYLNWFEQARYDALESAGLSPNELLRRGWGIHVVRIEVDYRAECRLGDPVEVHTVVESVRNSSMTIVQKLYRQTDVLASDARVTAVWIGEDGRPMRIPEEIRARFREDGGQSPGR
jgi:thioesterase-3